ncbi:MAG: hypothetical protein ACRD43_12000 [Pyrinomonadaceae bacterium]
MLLDRKAICVAMAVLCLSIACFADVAPEPGHKRVYLSLALQTRDDLSDYRFFVESGGQLEEVKLSLNQPVTIDPKGGGARYNSATVYAVPKKGIRFAGAVPDAEELAKLESSLTGKGIAGAVKLVDHSFSFDVPEAEADSYTNPIYQVRRDGQFGLVAERLDDGSSPSTHVSASPVRPTPVVETGRGLTLIVASLLTFAAVLAGLWLLQRKVC